jgi:uncharacterized protein (TIGR02270 family)
MLPRKVVSEAVQEHLDEAEFLLERFESALSATNMTIDQVAKGVESRLLAHLDGLVVGGEKVVEQILVPALEAKKLEPARVAAITIALLQGGRAELAMRTVRHESPAVARAAVRGCALAAGGSLDAWIQQELATRKASKERLPLLELAADRGLAVPSAAESLQSADPREITAALRGIHAATPLMYERRVLELFEHPDPLVRDAALLTSLHHGSLQGWAFCQALALDPMEPHPLAMTLLAGLGEPGQHKRLAERLDSDAHRPSALRAIGYSGNVSLIPMLVFHTHSKDERTVKLAGEAIATIAGDEVSALVRPKKPAPPDTGVLPPPEQDEEAKKSLPPLEEDDLDADLVPPAEEGLPTLDPAAVSTWWKGARTRFAADRRYLGGHPVTRGAFARALTQFPMRRRYLLSLLLSIRTGGGARVATRAFTAVQRGQIAALAGREGPEAWGREFSLF